MTAALARWPGNNGSASAQVATRRRQPQHRVATTAIAAATAPSVVEASEMTCGGSIIVDIVVAVLTRRWLRCNVAAAMATAMAVVAKVAGDDDSNGDVVWQRWGH